MNYYNGLNPDLDMELTVLRILNPHRTGSDWGDQTGYWIKSLWIFVNIFEQILMLEVTLGSSQSKMDLPGAKIK